MQLPELVPELIRGMLQPQQKNRTGFSEGPVAFPVSHLGEGKAAEGTRAV